MMSIKLLIHLSGLMMFLLDSNNNGLFSGPLINTIMNATTNAQATDIHYIVKLLTLDTETDSDVIKNVETIRLYASTLISKCDVIQKEMKCSSLVKS